MVEPPTFVELEVTEPNPGFKGDTATNVTKPATLETGPESRCPCSSTRATRSKSTPAPATTWSAARPERRERTDKTSGRAGLGPAEIRPLRPQLKGEHYDYF